jgi:hypothetical protein
MDATDDTDELARKLIEAFEPLGEEVILEQLTVPEDLTDPEGTVDLWVATVVATAETYDFEEEVVVRAKVSVPITVALEWEAAELGLLFREELLNSQQFRHACRVVSVTSLAAQERGLEDILLRRVCHKQII